MKIAYLVKYFHPIKGGAENFVLNLAFQALRDGHEVHVYTGDRKGEEKLPKGDSDYKGIKIHRCPFWFDFTYYLFFNPSLLFKFSKEEFDIVHVSGFGFLWHDFVLILKKIKSKKTFFINSPHGPFMTLGSYNIFKKLLRSIYTFIQKFFLNWLYDIVTQTNSFQWQWIVKYGVTRDKIRLLTPGIDKKIIERNISEEEMLRFRQKYDLADKFVLSYLGRISKYKGVQDIIRNLPKLIELRENIILLIMGRDDGYVRSLKVLSEKLNVRDHIRFIVDVSEEEKYIGLNASEIIVFPSEWEAFGIVLLEAMTQKNAIVSTKTEGGNYLVTDGVNGFKYDFSETEQLGEILERLISNKDLLDKMQSENKQRVKKFSWESIYNDSYKEILDTVQNSKI